MYFPIFGNYTLNRLRRGSGISCSAIRVQVFNGASHLNGHSPLREQLIVQRPQAGEDSQSDGNS